MLSTLKRPDSPSSQSSSTKKAKTSFGEGPEKKKILVVLGEAWGDEGKGKHVDHFASNCQVMCRFNGGSNAGHTVVANGKTFKFHQCPSGITNPGTVGVLGNGVLFNAKSFLEEIDAIKANGITDVESRIKISSRAHMVLECHKIIDAAREDAKKAAGSEIGTTRQGISPCLESKIARVGCRVGDLLRDFDEFKKLHKDIYTKSYSEVYDLIRHIPRPKNTERSPEYYEERPSLYAYRVITAREPELLYLESIVERLRPMICDTVEYVHDCYNKGMSIIAEGANAALLDIDHGSYPYVTGSSCCIGAVCNGLGVNHHMIGEVYGVMKAYTTRVGNGPFPTELLDEKGEALQTIGHEIGTTTGRKRRCGWPDVVVARYTAKLNGYDYLIITKLDVLDLFKTVKIAVKYTLNGKEITCMPFNINDLQNVEVEYVKMPGWKTNTSKVKTYAELPKEARDYLEKIEELTGIPVKYVGVGPDREAIIEKPINK